MKLLSLCPSIRRQFTRRTGLCHRKCADLELLGLEGVYVQM